MIKSKKTNIVRTNTNTTCSSEKEMKSFMAHIKNYKCLFCHKRIYLKNFENAKCSCNSAWFEKLPDKKAKVVMAI